MHTIARVLMFVVTAAACLSLSTTPSTADYTGADLLQDCTFAVSGEPSTSLESFRVGRCYGAVIAIAQAGDPLGTWGADTSVALCIGQRETMNEILVRQVAVYLSDHPHLLKAPAAELVILALRKQHPCS